MHQRIDKVLIANRGEIAVRIARTCRAMGITSVAVFSDADEDALHVRAADEAVRIGPADATESYLAIDKVLAAAERTGADAIHPGYGFLAENPRLAEACAERGLIFIGPSAEVIRLLGSKSASKSVVEAAGVPVVPGYSGADQDAEVLAEKAREIGFPVLIKASAGGGGKGMRVVRDPGRLAEAIASAKREAMGAFGDDTLLIETYIDEPRHIELQIIGDRHGQIAHLFERECSIQRRHQKIIEETPAPGLDGDKRRAMAAAAVAVGRAVGYVNAGTVEFILAPDGRFYFLEVNTRLQVEHPITEAVTGVDLVREQIRVARGERLQLDSVETRGAAIECRLYAEDPDRDFLPMTGRILDWHLPERVAAATGLRMDSGVATGHRVDTHYDPMLAKLVCHAPTRAEAVHKMVYCLRAFSVQGITCNRDFLVRVLEHPAFQAGHTHTHFLHEHADALRTGPAAPAAVIDAALAATLCAHERRRHERRILPALEPGFRNSRGDLPQRVQYRAGGDHSLVVVRYHNHGAHTFEVSAELSAESGTDPATREVVHETVKLVEYHPCGSADELVVERADGVRRRVRVVCEPGDDAAGSRRWYVHEHGARASVTLAEEPRFPRGTDTRVEGGCMAPMPGRIVKLAVSPGHTVCPGDVLVVLEAMKMEHAVKAVDHGVVESVRVAEGEQVDADTLLVVLTPTAPPE